MTRDFRAGIGLAEHERIAGFIHIGAPTLRRKIASRPALADIVSRFRLNGEANVL